MRGALSLAPTVERAKDVERCGGCGKRPWAGGDREVYLRIVPAKVTGRRIETR
jgi:hypothetical protein